MIAFFGGGVPKVVYELMPELSPPKALLASVFLYNMPHMVRGYLTSKVAPLLAASPNTQYEEVSKDETYGELIKRAQWTHNNGLESFPVFAAGVIAATVAGVERRIVGKLAAFHLLTRCAYSALYMGGGTSEQAGYGRAVVWMLSLLSSCQLLKLAADASKEPPPSLLAPPPLGLLLTPVARKP
eukprot:CAMPEP_0176263298 /NCGR_PEP_ID=MMETSP0121_2-20121125/41053_1 /TAXON_ID=160619 /ORGANISM="Kryptoperidinium foliaceum, Strain CCMP 1326" /LENGTH=183 /DNA_ID=CAMNT_0017603289 /DNA_START=29 /DNA_END=581 /DNA_ORIENTATION=-